MTDDSARTGGRPTPGGKARLGHRTVARIGYGAMQLDRLRDDRDAAVRLLRRAFDAGVNHVDTAQFYGDGFVNGVVGEALRPDDEVTVATKIGADPDPAGSPPVRSAQRPEDLRASVEQNLRTLGLDQIPIVNLRRMDAGHDVPQTPDQVVDLDDQLAEMSAMRDEGLIGAIGLSSTTIDVLRRGLAADLAEVQNSYSLVNRADEPMLDLCIAEGIAWVPYFPLGSAFPGLPKVTDEADVRSIAADLDVMPAQVGLAWLLQHSANTLLIPGTTSPEHLDANLAVAGIHLDLAAVDRLDHIPTRLAQG